MALCVVFGCNISCENESKAYEKAMKSRKMAELNAYLSKYENKASQEHIDSVSEKLIELFHDSLDYEEFTFESDIVERHELGELYKMVHPEGLYIDKVVEQLELEEDEYQKELQKMLKYDELREMMEWSYYYQQENSSLFGIRLPYYANFTIPDKEGKGLICFRYGSDPTQSIVSFYEINDNYEIETKIMVNNEPHSLIWYFSDNGQRFINKENKNSADAIINSRIHCLPTLLKEFDGIVTLKRNSGDTNIASHTTTIWRASIFTENYEAAEYAFHILMEVGIREKIMEELYELKKIASRVNDVEAYRFVEKELEELYNY